MTRWTHAAVVGALTVSGCSEPAETRVEYILVQPEAGGDAVHDAASVDGPGVNVASDAAPTDAGNDASPDADSSSHDATIDAGPDAGQDAIDETIADAPHEATGLPDADAALEAEAGPGVPCPCEYAYQCKCLSSSSQTYPFEVTGEIIYGQGTQYVIATCPPGETRSDGLNNCWPTGDVKTLQPGWEDGANGWRCAGWFEPQCTGCPVPHGTLTTRTRCNRDWCNEWAACK